MKASIRVIVQPERAYLEMARAFLGASFHRVDGQLDSVATTVTDNTAFALVSMTYIFSHASIVAFMNAQLALLWSETDSPLRKEFPHDTTLHQLLRQSRLAKLKESIKALCRHRGIRQIQDVDPELWNDLLQVCKRVRDFVLHPKPIQPELEEVMRLSHMVHTLGFPSQVAARVLSHLITGMGAKVPKWVKENQEFQVRNVAALSMRQII